MLRPFHSAYLEQGMRGNAFLPRGIGDASDRRARVEALASRRLSPELLQELRAQSAALPPSPARDANLNLLARPGTTAVITGQQVGLFLGPLYTVFKAASAIASAKALSAEVGTPCVPVFWLQTEDQDFAEIASCTVPGEGAEPLCLKLADDPAQERCSLADRTLGSDVTSLLEQLAGALSGLPRAGEVLELLRAHYRPGVAPGKAFAGVLASLFAEDGLVIFDPRQAVAARLLVPVVRESLVRAERLDSVLAERSRALGEAGFQTQIPPREGVTLAFFHLDHATGPRYRLGHRAGRFELPLEHGEVALSELLTTLERDPLRFSTSALLRPIAQDTLFPTAVYVGGAAEVDYFAELPPLYAEFGMEPPLVALRARFHLVLPRVRTQLGRLSLTSADLERSREELQARHAAQLPSIRLAQPGPEWLAELEARLDALAPTAASLDPLLARAVERTRASTRRALAQLARHHQRLSLARDTTWNSRLDQVLRGLRPEGKPQERVFSFPAFAAQVGLAGFRAAVLGSVVPFDPAIREIDL